MPSSSPAARLVLDRLVEIYVAHDRTLYRAVSYDFGESWPVDWAPLAGAPPFEVCMSPSVCGSAEGRRTHIATRRDGETTGAFFYSTSDRYWRGWISWQSLGSNFTTAPAIATRADGEAIYLAGRQIDKGLYFAGWTSGRGSGWRRLGSESFSDETPAVASRADGQVVHVAALGGDRRHWIATSLDGGVTFGAWFALGGPEGCASPALTVSASGAVLHVFGWTADRRFIHTRSDDGGAGWTAWTPVAAGEFLSGSVAVASADGSTLLVAGRGLDDRMWVAVSRSAGDRWDRGWNRISDRVFA